MPWPSATHHNMIMCYVIRSLQETQSPFCLTSIILSIRFIFSLGLMISGRTRLLSSIKEHTNEICYTLTWSKNTIKFSYRDSLLVDTL